MILKDYSLNCVLSCNIIMSSHVIKLAYFVLNFQEGCRFTLNVVTCFQLQQSGIFGRQSKIDYESL